MPDLHATAAVLDEELTMFDTKWLVAIRAFLEYSWDDIEYDYEQLTAREKAIFTREEFGELVKWTKGEL